MDGTMVAATTVDMARGVTFIQGDHSSREWGPPTFRP